MKKLFLLAASAMMVFASCSKTDIIYQDETPQEIGLFPVAKKQTKAAIDGTEFSYTNMMVAAYLAAGDGVTPGAYFSGTTFEKGNSNFTGGKYWPIQNSTLNFLATAPVEDGISTEINAETGVATVTLTDNQSNQYDVMYAVARASKYNKVTPVVGMTFEHALAWVKFKITGTNEITINKITVNGAKYNGTLTVTTTNWTESTNDKELTADFTWTDGETMDNITVPTDGLLVRPCDATSFVINYTVTNGNDVHVYNYTYNPDEWIQGKKYIYNITMSLQGIEIAPVITDWTDTPTPDNGITIQ